MKKITKSIIAVLSVSAIFAASLPVSASAADETIQPRGSYHLYGDINNDGRIDTFDASHVLSASETFYNLTGSKDLPLEFAIARPSVYFEGIKTPVPQAADTNGDGIINKTDAQDILDYYANAATGSLSEYKGNCGKPFFVE